MDRAHIISDIAQEMKSRFESEGSGHDWFHLERVWKNAKHLAQEENANMFVVELAALLHDIADWKFHDGDETAGSRAARELMTSHGVEETMVAHVCNIIDHLSYKGAGVSDEMSTLEGKIVQDADRLDALGAIGIARAFAYGGHKGRLLHDPSVPPELHATKDAYKKNAGPTLNHFYEKLFLLKDRMKTEAGKRMAEERDIYMREYVERFLKEWDGEA